VAKIYFHEDYLDNVRLNGCSKILLYLLTGQVFMDKKSFTKRRYEVFYVEFCAKSGPCQGQARKLHERGKPPIVILASGKIRLAKFKTKSL